MNRNLLYHDPTCLFLAVNTLLVITGYALAVITNKATVPVMQGIKYSFLLISIAELCRKGSGVLKLIFSGTAGAHTICALFIGSGLLSGHPRETVFRTCTFVVPFLYVLYATGFLLLRYRAKDVLNAFVNMLNLVYSIPVVLFFLAGGSFSDTNIYHIAVENTNSAFVSNHYGWAGLITLVTGTDLLVNTRPAPVRRLFTIFSCLSGLYLVLISGNRSSWLSLCAVFPVFMFRYAGPGAAGKILLAAIPVVLVLMLSQDPGSAINRRIDKTLAQLKTGEPRQKIREKMFAYFRENPTLYLKGIGGFNKKEISRITGQEGYHNSYLDVLFGAGLPTFLLFFFLVVLRPAGIYLSVLSRYYLFLPPLLIIPLFESDLTGGQFLFFPWMIAALSFSYLARFSELKSRARQYYHPAIYKQKRLPLQ